MPILAKGDDVRSGTKANASHGHRRQWFKSSTPLEYVRENFKYLTEYCEIILVCFTVEMGLLNYILILGKTYLWTCRCK